jgi:hypothetical protein
MYFGQLYNFGQCALTMCFNCFIVVICNLGTQMQWCGLHGPSPYEHVQCDKCQLAWMLPCHMHGLCDNPTCNCLATLMGLHYNLSINFNFNWSFFYSHHQVAWLQSNISKCQLKCINFSSTNHLHNNFVAQWNLDMNVNC